MPATKVKVPIVSTVTTPAIEPILLARPKSVEPITLKEGFLTQFKKLKPVDGTLPVVKKVLETAPKNRIVVGISGISCGGKTTVAQAVADWLGSYGTVINQDHYYRPPHELAINPFTKCLEFDEPESLRMDNIRAAIKTWQAQPIDSNETQVLLVEGTMIFTDPEICKLCDLRYLIHADFETVDFRRSLRKYPIPDPPQVMAKNIWPKYIKHRSWFCDIAEREQLICKQIDGTEKVQRIVAGIIQDVKINKHQ